MYINTHFDIFLKNFKRLIWVTYIFLGIHVYVLGSMSGALEKTQWPWYAEKCNLLSEATFLPYFMTVWCVFFTRVSHFVCVLPMLWCLSCFSSQNYNYVI